MLPAALVAIPAAFQVTIMALGVSRQQAADAGWVLQPKVQPLAGYLGGGTRSNVSSWTLPLICCRFIGNKLHIAQMDRHRTRQQ